MRHGWLARKGSGATALATLTYLGHSVIVGHTHRQALVYHTQHKIDGRVRIHCGIEAGTLAQVSGGLGYAVAPDWQPGFCTVYLNPDGTFSPSLATYVSGRLLWQGQAYWHDERGRIVVSV